MKSRSCAKTVGRALHLKNTWNITTESIQDSDPTNVKPAEELLRRGTPSTSIWKYTQVFLYKKPCNAFHSKVQKWYLCTMHIKKCNSNIFERHQCAVSNCIRNIVTDWELSTNAQLMYGFTICMIIKTRTYQLTQHFFPQVKDRIIVRTAISSSLNSMPCRDIRESTRERSPTCAACVEERLLTNPPYAGTPW